MSLADNTPGVNIVNYLLIYMHHGTIHSSQGCLNAPNSAELRQTLPNSGELLLEVTYLL